MSDFQNFAAACGLTIEPFQRRIVRAVASPEREVMILLPRGQGKTALMAAVALHHLVTVERARVFCAAASREQAKSCTSSRRASPANSATPAWSSGTWNCAGARTRTSHAASIATCGCWRHATKLHGLTYPMAILDELQAHSKLDVYEALNSALHKQATAKMVVISTAGQGADSPLRRLRSRALALPAVKRRGAVTDARGPDLRFLEWACSDDDDVDNPRVVKRACPASWVTVDQLRAARASLPDLAHRRFVANQWTERAGHWLPPGAWQGCAGNPTSPTASGS